MHNVSNDNAFLSSSLKDTIKVDDFTRNLFDLHKRILLEGTAQPVSLGLFRADYMIDKVGDEESLKQVEVNAIASSFGALAPRVRDLHKLILSKYTNVRDLDNRLPRNESTAQLANGLIQAWDMYGVSKSVILVVVEERTINICDQRILEFTLASLRPDIHMIRRKFVDLSDKLEMKGNNLLYVDGYEIAVVYYRNCYSPEAYPKASHWELRFKIEKSKAIKCPSIHYHLAGVKKIQQILTDPDELGKFVSSEESELIRKTFVPIYGLEMNEEGNKAIKFALENPVKYVLKPQREGGGNNVYGLDIVDVLNKVKNTQERESYILMDMIRPPLIKNYIISSGRKVSTEPIDLVNELGIFGVIIGTPNEILCNYEAGYVLRSKKHGVQEGGIAAGFGCLDSVYLY